LNLRALRTGVSFVRREITGWSCDGRAAAGGDAPCVGTDQPCVGGCERLPGALRRLTAEADGCGRACSRRFELSGLGVTAQDQLRRLAGYGGRGGRGLEVAPRLRRRFGPGRSWRSSRGHGLELAQRQRTVRERLRPRAIAIGAPSRTSGVCRGSRAPAWLARRSWHDPAAGRVWTGIQPAVEAKPAFSPRRLRLIA